MSESKIYLGIDVGTQGTKVLLYDGVARRVLARGSAPHHLMERPGGHREQEAAWWLDALTAALMQLPEEGRNQVQAIGVSGQQHGLVPLDIEGKPLRPVKLWNDTSTAAECAIITRRLGGVEQVIGAVGNPMLPGYTAPKLGWMKTHEPHLYERIHTVLLPHDYVNFALTGIRCAEAGDASGTALFDIRNHCWSQSLLNGVDDSDRLLAAMPRLVAADEVVGQVTETAATRFGLPAGTLVCSGGGDNMMAAIGLGAVLPAVLGVSLGTSGTLFAYSGEPVIDMEGEVAAFCDSTGGYLPLVCTQNCTVATELARRAIGVSVSRIDELAASAPAGCDGLLTVPFFTGERTPNLPMATGTLFGLTPSNYQPGHLLRSSMEAAVFGLRRGHEAMARLGVEATEIRLAGGGANSDLWRQMVADVFDLAVRIPKEKEAAAFGAALKALWVDDCHRGQNSTMAAVCQTHVAFENSVCPHTRRVGQYRDFYGAYSALVAELTPLFKKNEDVS